MVSLARVALGCHCHRVLSNTRTFSFSIFVPTSKTTLHSHITKRCEDFSSSLLFIFSKALAFIYSLNMKIYALHLLYVIFSLDFLEKCLLSNRFLLSIQKTFTQCFLWATNVPQIIDTDVFLEVVPSPLVGGLWGEHFYNLVRA